MSEAKPNNLEQALELARKLVPHSGGGRVELATASMLPTALAHQRHRSEEVAARAAEMGFPVPRPTEWTEAQKQADRVAEQNEICWLRSARNGAFRQRGTAEIGFLGIVAVMAMACLSAAFLVLGLWALGYHLLTPLEEREAIARAKVWRDKRRELNESVEARRVR